jgi:hypothetical protein
VSAVEHDRPEGTTRTEAVAEFLATFAIFAGLISIVYYPGRLGVAALFVAIFAAALGGTERRLVPLAVAVTTVSWFAGMIVAIALDRPFI